MTRCVLSVAGTDPTGGAGIQADIKTISALGGYALSVITAVVAQNSSSVLSTAMMNSTMVRRQLQAVFEEFPVHAIKIGMLGSEEALDALQAFHSVLSKIPVVFDPVLYASAGQGLFRDHLLSHLKHKLFPHITVLTPNLKEAAMLLQDHEASSCSMMECQAWQLQRYVPWVLLKGGHFPDEEMCPDLLVGPGRFQRWFYRQRLKTPHGRGTGCTLSSALAYKMIDYPIPQAVEEAREYVWRTIHSAHELNVVSSRGPLNHFY